MKLGPVILRILIDGYCFNQQTRCPFHHSFSPKIL